MLCHYAIDKSTFIYKNVTCSIDNKFCTCWRWCPELMKPIMNDTFKKYGCKTKNEYEKNQNGGDNNG